MRKLEKVIFNTLDKYKGSSINLSSEAARLALAYAIASEIRDEIEKERESK